MSSRPAVSMPFSEEAERGVLSGLVHDPVNLLDELAEKLPAGAFYYPANEAFYEVLCDMRWGGKAIDSITFTSRARDLQRLEVIGGENAVYEIYSFRPTPFLWQQYVRILQEKRALRELLSICGSATAKAAEPGADVVGLIDEFQKNALGLSLERDERGPVHVKEVLEKIDQCTAEAAERLRNGQQIAGWHTNLARLDHLTHGLERDDRYVIAGLSNTGKTARLTHMVRAFLEQGLRGLIFMLDGSAASAIIRLYAEVASVPVSSIKTGYGLKEHSGEKKGRLAEARAWLSAKGLFIEDTAAMSIMQINAVTRRFKKKHGIDFTAIDFFGNITCPGFPLNDRVNMLTAVSKAWKQGVIETGVPSIMLAQVNAEHVHEGRIPACAPHIIKDCKALYEDCTKMEALSREHRGLDELKEKELRIYDVDRSSAPWLDEGEQIIVHTVAKNKDLSLGHVWSRFNGALMRFRDLNPAARLADSSINKEARLRKQKMEDGME